MTRGTPPSRVAWIAAAALSALAWWPIAFAHAVLDKSEPPRRAVLVRSPTHVRLWFNERLEPAFCVIAVLDANGKPATDEPARVSPQNSKLLELALPALPPGIYSVQYKVLSVDGHTVKASYTFTVKKP